MREKERKFLLKDCPELEYILSNHYASQVKQGYLMLNEDGRQLRIRIYDNISCFVAYKYPVSKLIKEEFEFPIAQKEGLKLYASAERKIEKVRYHVTLLGDPMATYDNYADIDIYPDGLRIVEVEYKGKMPKLPPYCGKEVTGDPQYSNIRMAK